MVSLDQLEIVMPFVTHHLAACKTPDWDNHDPSRFSFHTHGYVAKEPSSLRFTTFNRKILRFFCC